MWTSDDSRPLRGKQTAIGLGFRSPKDELQAVSLIDEYNVWTYRWFLTVESGCLKMVRGHVHCDSWLRRFQQLAL
jgi:hypothetical protein